MTDRVFLHLSENWALGYDSQQWMLMKHVKRRNPRGRSNWHAVSFIGSTKRILLLTMREKGIEPTPEAQVAVDALPDTFREWLRQHEGAEVSPPQAERRCQSEDEWDEPPPWDGRAKELPACLVMQRQRPVKFGRMSKPITHEIDMPDIPEFLRREWNPGNQNLDASKEESQQPSKDKTLVEARLSPPSADQILPTVQDNRSLLVRPSTTMKVKHGES